MLQLSAFNIWHSRVLIGSRVVWISHIAHAHYGLLLTTCAFVQPDVRSKEFQVARCYCRLKKKCYIIKYLLTKYVRSLRVYLTSALTLAIARSIQQGLSLIPYRPHSRLIRSLSVCLSIYLSIYLPICLPTYLLTYLPTYVCMCVCMYV